MNLVIRQGFFDHPKVLELARRWHLSPLYAGAHLVALWGWTLVYRESGDLSSLAVEVVAKGAGWKRDPDRFINDLVEVGLLDRVYPPGSGRDEVKLYVHDWEEHQGPLIRERVKHRERMRAARAGERAAHVRSTETVREDARTPSVPGPPSPSPTPTPSPTHSPSPSPGGRKNVLNAEGLTNGSKLEVLDQLDDAQLRRLAGLVCSREPELSRLAEARSARDFLRLCGTRITAELLAEVRK